MNIRIGASWQTLFADLSIILFMITAATLSRSHEDGPERPDSAMPQPMPAASPVALYRAEPGSPPLGQWLEAQAPDSRQRLSILVPYKPGGQADALERAATMLRQAGEAGANVRVVIEPGMNDVTASLTFDAALARSLPRTPGNKETLP